MTPKQVVNRVESVRRRLQKALLSEVRLTVTDEEAARDELRGLMARLR